MQPGEDVELTRLTRDLKYDSLYCYLSIFHSYYLLVGSPIYAYCRRARVHSEHANSNVLRCYLLSCPNPLPLILSLSLPDRSSPYSSEGRDGNMDWSGCNIQSYFSLVPRLPDFLSLGMRLVLLCSCPGGQYPSHWQ